MARLLSVTAVLVCAQCGVAFADGPVGADPHSNFPVTQLPASCDQPTSPACLDASVGFLDQARASLGQGPYQLPADFDSLSPEIQQFILTNLDRIQYGLPPIAGITASLSQDAMGGVVNDADPQPTDPNFSYWTANWAGGFDNVVLAYEAWMYDDGPGSGNLDCTSGNTSGCWGHRHDILWSFGGSGPLAMGSAVGTDSSGSPGYAMLLGEGDAGSYKPAYTYTWSQAPANATNASGTGTPPPAPAAKPVTITVTVHGTGSIVDPAGHVCHNATCSFTETPGHAVRLVAHAAGHASFTGWSGQCSGAARTCTLSPATTGTTVSASFHLPQARISRRHLRGRAARVHVARKHAARKHAARKHAARVHAH